MTAWQRMNGLEVSVVDTRSGDEHLCGTINKDVYLTGTDNFNYFSVSCPASGCGDQVKLQVDGAGMSHEACIHILNVMVFHNVGKLPYRFILAS